jgi:hypothetical protein
MANQEHLAILKQGVKAWNEWRAGHPDIVPDLSGADLSQTNLRECNLFRAHLEGTNLQRSRLEGAILREAHLEGANLQEAHLEGSVSPSFSQLEWEMRYYDASPYGKVRHANDPVIHAADLRHAFFDSSTDLTDIILTQENTRGLRQFYFSAILGDVVWNDVNLAVVDWTQLNQLGDELLLHAQPDRESALREHRAAIRAYRQLATVLRSQGLNEAAAHYAYRAKVLERRILLKEIRLPGIMQAVIEGDEHVHWDWGRVVQGDISVYLGEPARHRKQASFVALLWQILLMFLLMIPLSQGSLAWGMLRLIWRYIPWKRNKEDIIAFLRHASSWLVPVLVLVLVLLPVCLALLLFPSFQSGWKPIVPVSIRGLLSLAGVFAAFYCFVFFDYFWQIYQALQACGEVGKGAYAPKVSMLLFDRLYWHVLLINEALRGCTRYVFLLFLDIFSGYGYKLGRSFCTYIFVIGIFAFTYHLLDSHLGLKDALIISMTAFHGRGFPPSQFQLSEPQSLVSAIEAFVGLIIEVTFIATLTQRFFEK